MEEIQDAVLRCLALIITHLAPIVLKLMGPMSLPTVSILTKPQKPTSPPETLNSPSAGPRPVTVTPPPALRGTCAFPEHPFTRCTIPPSLSLLFLFPLIHPFAPQLASPFATIAGTIFQNTRVSMSEADFSSFLCLC